MTAKEWSVEEAIAVMESHKQHEDCMFARLIATLRKVSEERDDFEGRACRAEQALRRIARISGDFEPHGFY